MGLIILYDEYEYHFDNGDGCDTIATCGFGLGVIADAVRCVVKEELKGNYELEMEYPVTGRRFADLTERRILFAKPNPYTKPQPFRIYSIVKTVKGTVTIKAAHISYDLAGYVAKPFEVSGSALSLQIPAEVVAHLNESGSILPAPRSAQNPNGRLPFHFSCYTDLASNETFKAEKPASVKEIITGSKDSFLDKYEAEPEFDNLQVIFRKRRGTDRGVRVEYGKNLSDISQELNCDEVYTAIYPYVMQDINIGPADEEGELIVSETGSTYYGGGSYSGGSGSSGTGSSGTSSGSGSSSSGSGSSSGSSGTGSSGSGSSGTGSESGSSGSESTTNGPTYYDYANYLLTYADDRNSYLIAEFMSAHPPESGQSYSSYCAAYNQWNLEYQ